MSAQPPIQTPVNWLNARGLRALMWAMLYAAITWAIACLGLGQWPWQYLAATELGLLGQFVFSMTDPNIIAPVSLLNFRNKT